MRLSDQLHLVCIPKAPSVTCAITEIQRLANEESRLADNFTSSAQFGGVMKMVIFEKFNARSTRIFMCHCTSVDPQRTASCRKEVAEVAVTVRSKFDLNLTPCTWLAVAEIAHDLQSGSFKTCTNTSTSLRVLVSPRTTSMWQ